MHLRLFYRVLLHRRLINASNAPSHNFDTSYNFFTGSAAHRFTKSLVGSNVVGNVAITPIRFPNCTAWSAIGWSTRNTVLSLHAAAAFHLPARSMSSE
jgi:hypothetical protein